MLVAMTGTLGMTAPLWSVTAPVMVPRSLCPKAVAARTNITKARPNLFIRIDIAASSVGYWLECWITWERPAEGVVFRGRETTMILGLKTKLLVLLGPNRKPMFC